MRSSPTTSATTLHALPQFFETAARVLDIDQKRRKSLAYVSALSPAERNNALAPHV